LKLLGEPVDSFFDFQMKGGFKGKHSQFRDGVRTGAIAPVDFDDFYKIQQIFEVFYYIE